MNFSKQTKVTALSLFLLAGGSCSSLLEPPAGLAVDYTAVSVPGKGYVVRLGYFTRAEIRSAEWEFARARHANMRACDGFTTLIKREVRWYEPTALSGEACASVVYTVRCLPHDDTSQVSEMPQPEDFKDVRGKLLTEVPGVIGPGCGEKDSGKIPYVPFDPPKVTYEGKEYERIPATWMRPIIINKAKTGRHAEDHITGEPCDLFLHDGTLLRCARQGAPVKGSYTFGHDHVCTEVRHRTSCFELYQKRGDPPLLLRDLSSGELAPVFFQSIESIDWAREMRGAGEVDRD